MKTCTHEWQLTEDGYTRTWRTQITEDGTVTASYSGTPDWSDEGSGMLYLECRACLKTAPVTDDARIEWAS